MHHSLHLSCKLFIESWSLKSLNLTPLHTKFSLVCQSKLASTLPPWSLCWKKLYRSWKSNPCSAKYLDGNHRIPAPNLLCRILPRSCMQYNLNLDLARRKRFFCCEHLLNRATFAKKCLVTLREATIPRREGSLVVIRESFEWVKQSMPNL